MKIKLKELERCTLMEFADKNGLEMSVKERDKFSWGTGRYYSSFENFEIKDSGYLVGICGNGSTKDGSVIDYMQKISGKIGVFGAYTENRNEINIPLIEFTGELFYEKA